MGMIDKVLCPKCGHEPASKSVFQCSECRSILEVHVNTNELTDVDFQRMRQSRDQSIWRWFDFFPVSQRSSIVSLDEGGTPLIPAARLGANLGIAKLI